MIRELIDQAIYYDRSITITYSKDGGIPREFHLIRLSYSPKYGNDYLVGYSTEYDSELTFKIDKIIDADIEWLDVLPPDYFVKRDGLYLVTCRSDNHMEYELRKYNKGEDMIALYKNEDGVESPYYEYNLLSYHYIPYYTEADNKIWIPFDKEYKDVKRGLYTFAYTIEGQEVEDDWDDLDWKTRMNTQYFPTQYPLNKTTVNGIHFAMDFIHVPFDKLRMGENINILAYNYCSRYTELNHANHWDLARKMGVIK